MCGIAGLIAKGTNRDQLFDRFLESSKLITHRGPDYMGFEKFDNTLLIHYRLSIIDTDPRSHQPFNSSDSQYSTVYNGEIYNFGDIKSKHSYTTHTTSDTEVMLQSFVHRGRNAIAEWNGIFAMAILDKGQRKLTLVRDRFGVKPLYWYEDEEVIMFASEAKVLYDWLPQLELSYQGLSEYLWFGNTISSDTMIKGVRKFNKGTSLEIDLTSFEKNEKTYWENKGTKPYTEDLDTTVQQVKRKLTAAVERQLIADVPLGILLSGGVDSSAIVALASQISNTKLDTYSVQYDYNIGGESELPRARKMAALCKTNHHELKIGAGDVVESFQKLVFQYDEPFADAANIPLYQLAEIAGKNKKVILQGDGGDEFFAGYRRYNVLDWLGFWKIASTAGHRFIPNKRWAERMSRMSFVLNQKDHALRMAYFLTQDVPEKSPLGMLNSDFRLKADQSDPFNAYKQMNSRFKSESKVQRMLYTDTELIMQHTYLEKVDKATMLSSVESRVPFLDNELTEYVLGLPSSVKVRRGEKKFLLKQALKGLVPEEILYGKKRGFDVPYKDWLKKDLYDFAHQTFSNHPINGLLDKESLIDKLERNRKGEANYGPMLWKALVLSQWFSVYANKLTF